MRFSALALALLGLSRSGSALDIAAPKNKVGRCQLGKSGPAVSCIAYGTSHLHEAGSAEKALEMIELAVENGITTFDLSDVYNSEPELFGAALQLKPGLRERVEVIAKMDVTGGMDCGFTGAGAYDTSPEHLDAVLDKYLKAMNSTYVDVLMLHRQDYLLDIDEMQQNFQRWQSQSMVRHLGVSNFDRSSFEALNSRVPLVANEIEISALNPKAIFDGTVSFHYSVGSGILAWGALGGDPWGGPNRLFKVGSLDGTPRNAKIKGALSTVGDLMGVENDVAGVAWLLRHPAKIVPIIGTMNPERLVRQAGAYAAVSNMTRQQWYHIADAVGIPIN